MNRAGSAQSGASRAAAAINQTIRRVVGDHTGPVHEFTRSSGVAWVEFADKGWGMGDRLAKSAARLSMLLHMVERGEGPVTHLRKHWKKSAKKRGEIRIPASKAGRRLENVARPRRRCHKITP